MIKNFSGRLVPGVGRGAKFISMDVYYEIFQKELGSEPFRGTLNVKIPEDHRISVEKYFQNGKAYDNLQNDGKPTGGIITNSFKIMIKEDIIRCIGVRPLLTSHDNSIVEFVSSIELRSKYELHDNDELTIYFD